VVQQPERLYTFGHASGIALEGRANASVIRLLVGRENPIPGAQIHEFPGIVTPSGQKLAATPMVSASWHKTSL
jgi:hypothetical protein